MENIKRTTGEFDSNGKEIFEGDSVSWPHQWFRNYDLPGNPVFTLYRLVKIIYDQSSHRFVLGTVMNNWKGPELTKIGDEDIIKLRKLNVRHECDFSLDEKGDYWVPEMHHRMGCTREQAKKFSDSLRRAEERMWFGKI